MPQCMCKEPIRVVQRQHVATAAPLANAKIAFAMNSAVPVMSAATVHAMLDVVLQVHAVRAVVAASSNYSQMISCMFRHSTMSGAISSCSRFFGMITVCCLGKLGAFLTAGSPATLDLD